MKVYLKGLITGASLVFAFMVFTGQNHGHHDNHGNPMMDITTLMMLCIS